MNSIPFTSGVYILVFHLSQTTTITHDRKGSRHTFSPGWYLYVGSACGAGGLNRRLARHQRHQADGKKMHWNIDFFREHAMLCEVWYYETADSAFEHRWAKTLTEMAGTIVPVPKLGANDCTAKCPSHFFRLPARPSTATFRAKLAWRGLSTNVVVEFIAEPRKMKQSARGLQREYQLGRRFLELRRRSISESSLEPSVWASLAKGKPARQLADQVAEVVGIPFPKLKLAIQFATAVETLIENCGEPAWATLFDPIQPQSRKAIMTLSRTSDVRQRYRVNGVMDGSFRSVAPHSDDTVFDTVRYGEVLSRLAKARGSLAKLLALLTNTHEGRLLEEAKRLSRLCRLSAKRLDDCLRKRVAPASAVPGYLGKVTIMQTLRSDAAKGRTIGMGRLALRLTVKNVWDFEEMMRRGLVPTTEQLQDTRGELKQIQEFARQIECLGAIIPEAINCVGANMSRSLEDRIVQAT